MVPSSKMAVVYSAEKTLRVLVIARSSRKWSRTAIRLEGLRQTKLDRHVRMIVRPGWCPSQKMPRHIIYEPSSREKGVERRNAPRNTRYLSAFRTASSGVVPKHHQSTPKLYGRPRITTYHRARPLCLYGAVTKGVTTASLYFIQWG